MNNEQARNIHNLLWNAIERAAAHNDIDSSERWVRVEKQFS